VSSKPPQHAGVQRAAERGKNRGRPAEPEAFAEKEHHMAEEPHPMLASRRLPHHLSRGAFIVVSQAKLMPVARNHNFLSNLRLAGASRRDFDALTRKITQGN